MPIKTDQYNNVRVIAVQGDFIAAQADDARTALAACMAPTSGTPGRSRRPSAPPPPPASAPRIILDLEQAPLIDSAALETITWAKRGCESAGGQLVVAGAGESCRTVLALTRLDRQIDCFSDVAAALKALEDAAA